MAKPQRIRSRTMLLIYLNLNSSVPLMEHLKKQLKVNQDNEWTFIIKTEQRISGQTDILVFIELKFNPDVYLHRLNFQHQGEIIVPSIHCWSDKELLFRFILTFYSISSIENTLLTNLDLSVVMEKAIILEGSLPFVKKDSEPSIKENDSLFQDSVVAQSSKVKEKPPITDKQIEKFNVYHTRFCNIITTSSSTPETLKELERYLRNMINYRSIYSVSEEINSRIKDCQSKLKEFKKNL